MAIQRSPPAVREGEAVRSFDENRPIRSLPFDEERPIGGGGGAAYSDENSEQPVNEAQEEPWKLAALNYNTSRAPGAVYDESTDGKLGSVYTALTEKLVGRGDWKRCAGRWRLAVAPGADPSSAVVPASAVAPLWRSPSTPTAQLSLSSAPIAQAAGAAEQGDGRGQAAERLPPAAHPDPEPSFSPNPNPKPNQVKLPSAFHLLLGTAQGKGIRWARLGYGM